MKESEKTISITVTRNQIKEFVSYIEKIDEKYLKDAQSTINNIYKILSTMQFFLPEEKDKNFVKQQIDMLQNYKEEELEPIIKSIRIIVESITDKNKKNPTKKSNDDFIEAIANIYRLLNNIENYDDLIKKMQKNDTESQDDFSDFENDIISTFEKCFNAINESIENDLINPEIYTNDEYIKVIENFINIIPKEKQKSFNKRLETINNKKIEYCEDLELEVFDVENYNESHSSSPKSEKTDTEQKSKKTGSKQVKRENSTNSSISESNVLTYSENKMEIKIKFNDSNSKEKFEEKFSKLKLKKEQDCLNKTLLRYKSLLKKGKISNITYNGKIYVGKGNIWDERNYSDTKLKQTQNSLSK